MKEKLFRVEWLRRMVLPILKKTSIDVTMKHHWVPGVAIRLNSFKHKGYWYHGKNRERATLSMIGRIVKKSDIVLEVGGHIGYFSVFFAHLAGSSGRVVVFEPGENNLPYIEKNICNSGLGEMAEIELIRAAAGATDGEETFYEEDLTGQNNSMVRDFAGLSQNSRKAYVETAVKERRVQVHAIDSLCMSPQFIKIDVEGFEWSVLQGAAETIEGNLPIIMVEVQADRVEIFSFFKTRGYLMFNDTMQRINAPEMLRLNVFCFHENAHKKVIDGLINRL